MTLEVSHEELWFSECQMNPASATQPSTSFISGGGDQSLSIDIPIARTAADAANQLELSVGKEEEVKPDANQLELSVGNAEEVRLDANPPELSDDSSSDNECTSSTRTCTLLSVEDKIEAALTNWRIQWPNVPKSTISTLLGELNYFFPGIPLSTKTIFAENLLGDISPMHNGRYLHMNDWINDLKKWLLLNNHQSSKIDLVLNCDGSNLFNDS